MRRASKAADAYVVCGGMPHNRQMVETGKREGNVEGCTVRNVATAISFPPVVLLVCVCVCVCVCTHC